MNNTTSKEAVNEEYGKAKRAMEGWGLFSLITVGTGVCIVGSCIINPVMVETAIIGAGDISYGVIGTVALIDEIKLMKKLKVMKSFLEYNPETYIPGTKKEFIKMIDDTERRPKTKVKTINNHL